MIRSFMAAQHLLLIGKLDLDLVPFLFGNLRIRLLHDLLGLLVGLLQKLTSDIWLPRYRPLLRSGHNRNPL